MFYVAIPFDHAGIQKYCIHKGYKILGVWDFILSLQIQIILRCAAVPAITVRFFVLKLSTGKMSRLKSGKCSMRIIFYCSHAYVMRNHHGFCISVQSVNGSENVILVLNSSGISGKLRYVVSSMDNPSQTLFHHQTGHAGWCCRLREVQYNISRLSYNSHMCSVLSHLSREQKPSCGLCCLFVNQAGQWWSVRIVLIDAISFIFPHILYDDLYINMHTISPLEATCYGSSSSCCAVTGLAAGVIYSSRLYIHYWETQQK